MAERQQSPGTSGCPCLSQLLGRGGRISAGSYLYPVVRSCAGWPSAFVAPAVCTSSWPRWKLDGLTKSVTVSLGSDKSG